MATAWENIVEPFYFHQVKPRNQGLTMVMDKGQGIVATKDQLQIAGPYIDFIKLGFGTSVFYPIEVLEEKIDICRQAGVEVYPGGTLLEAAIVGGNFEKYIAKVKDYGFSVVELSDGSITISAEARKKYIQRLKDMNFKVITEAGKKDVKEQPSMGELREVIEKDLAAGADLVIIEARESGKGIGIYDGDGKVKDSDLLSLVQGIDPDKIMFEAPLKSQQVELISSFGSNVNLGNIPVEEVIPLETLRTGLRGDTLKKYLHERTSEQNYA